MSCRLSIARVLATSRTQPQSPWAPASVPLASPPLLERRHRPRRASHHLHRPHKAVCMMPGLWEPEATLPDRPDTLVAALAVRQDAVSQPAPRTLLTDIKSWPTISADLRVRRGPLSLVRPRPRPRPRLHAPLACTLPDAGRARPSPLAASAFPSTWPLRTPFLLPVLAYPVVQTSTPSSIGVPFLHAHVVELFRTGTYAGRKSARGVGGESRGGGRRRLEVRLPAANVILPSIVFEVQRVALSAFQVTYLGRPPPSMKITGAHLHRSESDITRAERTTATSLAIPLLTPTHAQFARSPSLAPYSPSAPHSTDNL
ncbi:hypothetical protein DFH06DRAFT_1350203 [Mycena polygramma]|nr:hypothetical protein DFH06DRAFT_1350203 [Mycena polygramma]